MTRHLVLIAGCAFALDAQTRTMSMGELHDRIAGGWAGQMIGVSYGAPTEFRTLQKINEGVLPKWTPDMVKEALDQDDLYVDMTFAQVLDDKGINATSADFGNMFRDAKYRLWHANLAARRALKRDIPASLSGNPKYNAHANDIDFQIESDFIGLMSPGMPQASNSIADRAGRVMNSGDGLYGGMFVSCMYASAFFEKDVRRVVEAGVACLPAQSPYARVVSDVLAWSRQYPDDWRKVWHLIGDKWDKREPCPEGALKPFNIDAKLNGAYVVLGLLYGGGDFAKTIDVATRAGQDSDCNPSSAAGILGVMIGYQAIPEIWKSGIPELADKKFNYTNFTFNEIVASTQKRAIALAVSNGGRLRGDVLEVKLQGPKPAKLEIWDDYGSPVERVPITDARWVLTGGWTPVKTAYKTAARKGAEASIEFTGTGAIVTGLYQPTGGRYDVYLDGKLEGTLDSNSDESDTKSGESIWHRFGLANSKHTVRLVVRGEAFQRMTGTDVTLGDLVVFR